LAPSREGQQSVDMRAIEQAIRSILVAIGEDPEREGLRDTPSRHARWWKEFIEYESGNGDVTFEAFTTDQLVAVRGLRTWSLCEHHLLPFSCDIAIGYIAEDKILGLSKFGRIAQKFAHRLQVQERLVHEIACEIQRVTGAVDVAVVASGVHTCMTMRGVQMPATMHTSVMLGRFRDVAPLRAEFLALIGHGQL
jgi:GTP cyclohydrolase I